MRHRNTFVSEIESLKAIMENEQNLLDMYTEEPERITNSRNSKGEVVNFELMKENIKALQNTIRNLENALSAFDITASIYK